MRGIFRLTGAMALIALLASAGEAAVKKKAALNAEAPALAKPLAPDCEAHSFETAIQLTGPDGLPKQSKVHICGTTGQSSADWIRTLKDAVAKTSQNPQLRQAAKEQIIAAVNAEIARLSTPQLQLPTGPAAKAPEVPLSRDYAELPPLPTASSVEPPHVLGPASMFGPTLRLTLRCALIGDEHRPTDCDSIDEDTVMLLRADEAFPSGLDVRFVRKGNSRAEVTLPAMKPGQTAKLRLPPDVCAGVDWSRIEIQALGANAPSGSPAGKVGEYDLHC